MRKKLYIDYTTYKLSAQTLRFPLWTLQEPRRRIFLPLASLAALPQPYESIPRAIPGHEFFIIYWYGVLEE